MKVIVDTSVWSLAFRRRTPVVHSKVTRLRELIEAGEEVCLLGVILQEVLQGMRERRQLDLLQEALSSFYLIEPSREDYCFSAELWNRCAGKGISASTIDFLIAGTAIRHEALLLTTDGDFNRIASVAPLKVC